MQGTIINITRFCLDDGPGIRTTVFLKGCPLKCLWCHNPESQNPDEEYYTNGEKIGQRVTVKEVFQELIKDKTFYETSSGGITLSGGEPLYQADFSSQLLRLCKENGLHTAMETSGFASCDTFLKVLRYCDLVLFDIKETSEEKHRQYTGVPLSAILKNLELLDESKIPFIIRLPIIPGFNDDNSHFIKVQNLAKKLDFCQGIQIMPYHKLGAYKYQQLGREYACQQIDEPTKEQIEQWNMLLNHPSAK